MAMVSAHLPRVTIQFCTQCKWMLRAAYFAQELLSTFSTGIGEVALQPSVGGTFVIELFYIPPGQSASNDDTLLVQHHILWDRKIEGGFPETKELKRRVRDIIDPGRHLGHVDGKKKSTTTNQLSDFVSQSSVTSQAATLVEDSRSDQDQVQHGDEQQPVRRPKAISNLQVLATGDGERKFTPMDVDGAEMAFEQGGESHQQVKRNPDGSICEDC